MKKKYIAILIAIIVLVAAIVIFFAVKNKKDEYNAEMADLQGMRGAEATAMLLWKDKMPEQPMEYWFDADHYQLIPITDSMPDPCGKGSGKAGGAVKDFEAETGKSYAYNENEDYRDKVIHIIVGSNGAELDVTVDWASAKELSGGEQ